jgi:hypothetical protein
VLAPSTAPKVILPAYSAATSGNRPVEIERHFPLQARWRPIAAVAQQNNAVETKAQPHGVSVGSFAEILRICSAAGQSKSRSGPSHPQRPRNPHTKRPGLVLSNSLTKNHCNGGEPDENAPTTAKHRR